MRVAVLVAVLLTSSLATVPALAQNGGPPGDNAPESTPPESAPEEMAREGVELLLRALRGFLSSVPQYGLPRIEENGDIVIPRLNRGEQNEEDGDTDEDGPRDEDRNDSDNSDGTDSSDDSPEEIRT
ncbi:hypothetical protein [Aquibaculum sediminis]|uniref:hypothetical protein n=1 Tax=Aquibaculum sediminis TaxID=3231907 RepID=UPI00345231AE